MKRLISNFNSFEDAAKLCTYENNLICKRVSDNARKTPTDFRLVEYTDNKTVIDFGGGCGQHYYSTFVETKQGHFSYAKLWTVVETPEMVKHAKETETLKFTTEIPKDADVVLCSGALQYAPNWRKTLVQLLQTGAKLFIFRRMAFGWKEKITLQKSWLSENGGSCGIKDRLIFYPHTTIPKREFMDFIRGVNYIIQ
jgi:putative methyltransferase (TIGR04325 family)